MEMEVSKGAARRKAMLLTGGQVRIPADLKLPFLPSRSTAGPGAGTVGIVLCFEGVRVKKAISRESGEFLLVPRPSGYALERDGEVVAEGVTLQPTLFHSPEQAFFNLDSACIYSCKFCSSPLLDESICKNLSPDKVVRMIEEASHRPDFRSVALTSAVARSPRETVDKMAYVVRETRRVLGKEIPIGVEPYVSSESDIDLLKEAGADEIKLNIETFDRDIFDRVCGGQDYDWILKAIEYAVKVFGRGKVASNIIIGLGESDENILEGVEYLASRGCVATLRPLRVNELNKKQLEGALEKLEPLTADRLIGLAEKHKEILERHGLSTLSFKTMCHACTCCDITPFRDI